MGFKTYSFEDVLVSVQNTTIGNVNSGVGLGKVSLIRAGEKTAHDVASDGMTMISKLPGENGRVVLEMQQTSAFHRQLTALYNTINKGATAEWAKTTIIVASKHLADKTTCTGCSFLKVPDRNYEAQGGMVAWEFLSAEMTDS